jgi:general secretion pathway protein F
MPRFRYTAFSSDGVREDGTLEVASEAQAWDKLTSLSLTVVDLVVDHGDTARQTPGWTLRRGVPLAAQAELAEQLSVLFAARLSAMQIVEVVEKGSTLPVLRRKFQRIGQLMADGATFPDAFADAGTELHPLFVSLARIGQTTGDPAALMKSLASTLRRQQKIASQISGALVYPLILLVGGIGILVLMSLYLAPRLATIFTSVERAVPLELSIFIAAGELLRDWWPIIVIAMLALLVAVPAYARSRKRQLSRLIQRLPIVGQIARDASLSRFVRSVQIMLAAGMPLAPTLRATAAAMPFDPLARHFEAAGVAIEAGGAGRDSFAATPDLPAMFRELFAIGERTNTLPSVMDSAASALEDQVERRAQQAMTLLTPILTLFVGGGIALLVYAVMSALLSVNDLAF